MRLFKLGVNSIIFMKRYVDLLSLQLHGNARIQDTIIVSGTPRGGTTWFMELIETLPKYKSIFEPFHREWFPQVKRLNLPPRPYLDPNAEDKPLKDYLKQLFSGQIISHRPLFPLTTTTMYKRLLATKILVKFIRANRLLPWIFNNFRVRGIYYIIRHPCATIASQLETGIRGYPFPKDVPIPKKLVLYEASQIPEIRENEWLMSKLYTITTHEEVLAAIWSLDNYNLSPI